MKVPTRRLPDLAAVTLVAARWEGGLTSDWDVPLM